MSWFGRPEIQALAGTLLHSLWEGAVVALGLALVLRGSRNSRIRYAASCLAMVVLLAGLVVTFTHLVSAQPTQSRMADTGRRAVFAAGGFGVRISTVSTREADPADYLSWFISLWMAGVFVFYVRGMASWMAARRMRRTGVCCPPDLWHTRFGQLCARLRLSKPVALLESSLTEVPVVVGYLRPVILMPVGLLAGLPVTQVDAILLHELAHIRRYDYLVNLLQVFVEGLLFYHPAVWWISGVMRTEREYCCDDAVVAVTGGAHEYARALEFLEHRRANAGMALAATGGNLVNRIQRLLRSGAGDLVTCQSATMPVVTAAMLTIAAITAVAALQTGSSGQSSAHAIVVGHAETVITQSVDKPGMPQTHRLLAQAAMAPQGMPTQSAPMNREQYEEQMRQREERLEPVRTLLIATVQSEFQQKRWLEQEVASIISDEERRAFLQLHNIEERDKFMEQFWLRRDPTPGTPENEFRDEHYRRLAFANEHFAAENLAGWQSDRGRTYILYGPPDELDPHPSGGSYRRPLEEGGGMVTGFPVEYWRYRSIAGVGENITIEFADPSMTGIFHLAAEPSEKDALLKARLVAPKETR